MRATQWRRWIRPVGLLAATFSMMGVDCEPIPGGGPCKHCIYDAQLVLTDARADLWLCVDPELAYVGQALDPGDDVPFAEFLAGDLDGSREGARAHWSARVGSGDGHASILCTDCQDRAEIIPNGSDGLPRIRVTGLPTLETEGTLVLTINAIEGSRPILGKIFEPIRIEVQRYSTGDAVGPCPQRVPYEMLSKRAYEALLDPHEPMWLFKGLSLPASFNSAAASIGAGASPVDDPMIDSMAVLSYTAPQGGIGMCSGVLVSPQHVLTAAHCIPDDLSPVDLQVVVGATGIANAAERPKRVADAISIHPEWPTERIDLAVVRLRDPVSAPPARLASPAGSLGECQTQRSYGYGMFGARSPEPPYYDFGDLQQLILWDYGGPRCFMEGCLDEQTFLAVTTASPSAEALCHGDSGGPLVQRCGGVDYVVGIAAARVAIDEENALSRLLPFEGVLASFGFTFGNHCGDIDPDGFVATRTDTAEIKAWIDGVLGTTSVTGDFDGDRRIDVAHADIAEESLMVRYGNGAVVHRAIPAVRPGDRLLVWRAADDTADRLVWGAPTPSQWRFVELDPSGKGGQSWILRRTEATTPIRHGQGNLALIPAGTSWDAGSPSNRDIRLLVPRKPSPRALGRIEPTRRTTFTAYTNECDGMLDILALQADGHLHHHLDPECVWQEDAQLVLDEDGDALDVGPHRELVWVGELFDDTPEDEDDDSDDVVLVRRDPTAAVEFFSGSTEDGAFVLIQRWVPAPVPEVDEELRFGRVDDDEHLDLVFASRSSDRLTVALYDPVIGRYGERQRWPLLRRGSESIDAPR